MTGDMTKIWDDIRRAAKQLREFAAERRLAEVATEQSRIEVLEARLAAMEARLARLEAASMTAHPPVQPYWWGPALGPKCDGFTKTYGADGALHLEPL